jgi:hypothetical protein
MFNLIQLLSAMPTRSEGQVTAGRGDDLGAFRRWLPAGGRVTLSAVWSWEALVTAGPAPGA